MIPQVIFGDTPYPITHSSQDLQFHHSWPAELRYPCVILTVSCNALKRRLTALNTPDKSGK